MANIKRITITGKVAFNCHEHEFLKSALAFMNGPTSGIRISWSPTGSTPRPVGYVDPNKHGGKTALYQFSVSGEESVSYGWIGSFCNSIVEMDGKIYGCEVEDIENGEVLDFSHFRNFPIHK